MTKSPKDDEKPNKAILINTRNSLKEKVGYGGFDEKVIAKAQIVIEEKKIDLVPLATELLDILNTTVNWARSESISREKAIDNMLYTVVQLTAESSMSDYPVITHIGEILIAFLNKIDTLDDAALDIVEAHGISFNIALSDKITNKNGKALCTALTQACDRYYASKL